jgi:hypothetical protein
MESRRRLEQMRFDQASARSPRRSGLSADSRSDVAEFLVSEIQHNTHIHEIVGMTSRK